MALLQGMRGPLGVRPERERRRQRSLVSRGKTHETGNAPCCLCEPHRALAACLKDRFSTYSLRVGEAGSLVEGGATLPETALVVKWSSTLKAPPQDAELSRDYAMASSPIDKRKIHITHILRA